MSVLLNINVNNNNEELKGAIKSMLKFLKCIFLLLLIISLSSCSRQIEEGSNLKDSSNASKKEVMSREYKDYKEAISDFKPADSDLLMNKEKFKNKFIYFGRITCPYCRNFAPILKKASVKNNVDIYYVNTASDDQSKLLNEILNEYHIDEVPTLVYLNATGQIIKFSGDDEKSLSQFIQSKK